LDQDIVTLFQKYVDNRSSAAETAEVLQHIQDGTFHKEWAHVLEMDANQLLKKKDAVPLRNELSKMKLHHRLLNSVNDYESSLHAEPLPANHSRPKTIRLNWKSISIAATLILLGGWWLFNQQDASTKAPNDQLAYQSDIPPGKPGAKLRLANGKEITLDGAKGGLVVKGEQLRYNDGTGLEYTARPSSEENYTALTDKGNMYRLTLADGTQVWLNAASQLDFPAHFTGHTRQVLLKGEAFFKVSKDKNRPFIVESKGQQVKVLGTEFNINSYADEQFTKTTLVSGSIHISNTDRAYLLHPGQQASLDAKGKLSVADADTTLAVAWKNDKFLFEENDIQSVMRMLKRWYNVEVVYAGPLPEVTFGGKISRFNHVSSVLRVLETTGGVHFKTRGNTIYVFK
jgi:transmembrane sensor